MLYRSLILTAMASAIVALVFQSTPAAIAACVAGIFAFISKEQL